MKKLLLGVATSVMAILLLTPPCRADKKSAVKNKPDDQTVSLDLRFTKKKPNAMQRVFSFLDYGPNGFATGFVVGNGLVMTAYHAVSGNLTISKKVQLGFAPGDGKRYKGRGPIQLTGRANYSKYGGLLGLDLVNDPTIAATKEVGFRIAGQFWKLNGLNELADVQQFKLITKRINGGYNGLDDRIKYYERAKKVMSRDDTATIPMPVTPSSNQP